MSEYLWEDVGKGVWMWHIHHTRLLELSSEPLLVRAKYIRENKPEEEINLRLRMMRPVKNPDRIPEKVKEAGKAHDEALKAYDEALKAHNKALSQHTCS